MQNALACAGLYVWCPFVFPAFSDPLRYNMHQSLSCQDTSLVAIALFVKLGVLRKHCQVIMKKCTELFWPCQICEHNSWTRKEESAGAARQGLLWAWGLFWITNKGTTLGPVGFLQSWSLVPHRPHTMLSSATTTGFCKNAFYRWIKASKMRKKVRGGAGLEYFSSIQMK